MFGFKELGLVLIASVHGICILFTSLAFSSPPYNSISLVGMTQVYKYSCLMNTNDLRLTVCNEASSRL